MPDLSGDRQYGFDDIECSWVVPGFPGLNLKAGMSDGVPITESKTGPRQTMKSDGQGNVLFVQQQDRSGTLAISVVQEHPVHRDLQARVAIHEQLKNQYGILTIVDTSMGDRYIFVSATILDDPNFSRGLDGQNFVWTFGFARRRHIPGQAATNLVGG